MVLPLQMLYAAGSLHSCPSVTPPRKAVGVPFDEAQRKPAQTVKLDMLFSGVWMVEDEEEREQELNQAARDAAVPNRDVDNAQHLEVDTHEQTAADSLDPSASAPSKSNGWSKAMAGLADTGSHLYSGW